MKRSKKKQGDLSDREQRRWDAAQSDEAKRLRLMAEFWSALDRLPPVRLSRFDYTIADIIAYVDRNGVIDTTLLKQLIAGVYDKQQGFDASVFHARCKKVVDPLRWQHNV